MAEYMKMPALEAVAEKVIKENPELFERITGAAIVYMACNEQRSRDGMIKYADCEKVKDKIRALTGVDFIITFYQDGLALDDAHLERVMLHELLHVGYDAEEERRWINPHDLQDFKACVDRWGTNWVSE